MENIRQIPIDLREAAPVPLVQDNLHAATLLSTGFEACDRLMAGGLKPGELVEVYSQRSGGRFSIVLAALARATAAGQAAALIDLGDCLDPQSATAVGMDLQRVLWVRPRRLEQAMASAEILMSNNVPLVAIDLGIPPLAGSQGAEDAWLRLARKAREHRAALLVSSPFRIAGSAASHTIEAFQPTITWRHQDDGSPLLGGLSSSLESRPGANEHRELTESERSRTFELHLRTSDALAEDSSDIRVFEFPLKPQSLPADLEIALAS